MYRFNITHIRTIILLIFEKCQIGIKMILKLYWHLGYILYFSIFRQYSEWLVKKA